jgi:preprotein translocase subunit SecD
MMTAPRPAPPGASRGWFEIGARDPGSRARRSRLDTAHAAFDKAFSAIFDSNVTTLITAFILFWKATGPVKGFAVTLSLGVVCSVLAALLFSRVIFDYFVINRRVKTISI